MKWRASVEDSFKRERIDMKDVTEATTTSGVSAGQAADAPKFSFRHILVPTDHSPNSEKAIDCAIHATGFN